MEVLRRGHKVLQPPPPAIPPEAFGGRGPPRAGAAPPGDKRGEWETDAPNVSESVTPILHLKSGDSLFSCVLGGR